MKEIKDLNVDELQEVLERVKELRSEGYSYGKIVEAILNEYHV